MGNPCTETKPLGRKTSITMDLLITIIIAIAVLATPVITTYNTARSNAKSITGLTSQIVVSREEATEQFNLIQLNTQSSVKDLQNKTFTEIYSVQDDFRKEMASLRNEIHNASELNAIEFAKIGLLLSSMIHQNEVAAVEAKYKTKDRWTSSMMTTHDEGWLEVLEAYHPLHKSDIPDVKAIQKAHGYGNPPE